MVGRLGTVVRELCIFSVFIDGNLFVNFGQKLRVKSNYHMHERFLFILADVLPDELVQDWVELVSLQVIGLLNKVQLHKARQFVVDVDGAPHLRELELFNTCGKQPNEVKQVFTGFRGQHIDRKFRGSLQRLVIEAPLWSGVIHLLSVIFGHRKVVLQDHLVENLQRFDLVELIDVYIGCSADASWITLKEPKQVVVGEDLYEFFMGVYATQTGVDKLLELLSGLLRDGVGRGHKFEEMLSVFKDFGDRVEWLAADELTNFIDANIALFMLADFQEKLNCLF